MTETKAKARASADCDDKQMADFLKKNPDFFVGRDDLLLTLTLPHQRGPAISLVERQVALLRERNVEMRTRLAKYMDTARDNDRLFEKIRRMMLALLDCKDLEQLVETIRDSLDFEFNIDFHSLILFSNSALNMPVRIETFDATKAALGCVQRGNKAFSGKVKESELAFLFPDHNKQVESVAVIPISYSLNDPERLGILILGSKDKNHFRADMDTLFISFLGEVLSRMVAKLMPAGQS